MGGFLRFDADTMPGDRDSVRVMLIDDRWERPIPLPAVGDVQIGDDDRLGLAFTDHRVGDAARLLNEFWPRTFEAVWITGGEIGSEDFEALGRHRVTDLYLGGSHHDAYGGRHEATVRLPPDPDAFSMLEHLTGFHVHTAAFGDGHFTSLGSRRILRSLTLSGTTVSGSAIAAGDVRRLRALWISNDEAIADDLSFLTGLPELGFLALQATGIHDRHLPSVAANRRITTLDLSHNPVGEGSLEALGALSQLQALDLSNTRISDGTVGSLTAIRHNVDTSFLRKLTLSTTSLTDAAVSRLAELTSVKHLWLARTGITDDGLAALVDAMPQLEILDVSLTKITERGVPHIMGLSNLWRLDISPAVLDYELIDRLSSLPRLVEIDLRGPTEDHDLWAYIAETFGGTRLLSVD